MPRTAAVSLRVEPAVKQALEEAAYSDERTVAQYVERLILAHLRERGLLPEGSKEVRPSRRRTSSE
jgi:hypothetical protein